MQITLTKEQVKEAFGELRFMGADNCYRYDKDSKKKTEEVDSAFGFCLHGALRRQ